MRLPSYMKFVSFIVIAMTITQTCRAEEELPPIEHGDRFAYWMILKTRNLAKEVRILADNDSLYDLYTEISINLTETTELAMMSLERSASKEALRNLSYLTLIQLDGSMSEGHTCAVLAKGKSILPYLDEARQASSAGRCVIKEEANMKMKPGLCKSVADVKKRIDSFIEGIKEGEKC